MANIQAISYDELKKDLDDSYKDIGVCQIALSQGIVAYSGGSVKERLDHNKHFVKVIEAEIARRKKE